MSRGNHRANTRFVAVALITVLLVALCSPFAWASDGTYLTSWGSLGSSNGQMNRPHDVAVGPTGDIFVMDALNSRVQRFTNTGTFVSSFSSGAGTGTYGIHVDSAGNIFVADSSGNAVRKYNSAGALQLTISAITQARDVATDSSGNIYVVSQTGYVRKYDSAGSSYSTPISGLSGPRCLTLGATGDIYVTEFTANRVAQYSNAGVLVRTWGGAGSGNGQFSGDVGIATGPDGAIYTTEIGNNRIQKFTSAGVYVTKWGTAGAGNGQFNGVRGVAVDSAGVAYAADTDNHRIQKFGTTPPVITVTGVTAGGSYTAPVSITFSATDPLIGPLSATATLDGSPYTSGSPVSAPGAHTLIVTATDSRGNTSITTINFTVSAPVVSTSAAAWWSLALVAALGVGIVGRVRRGLASGR